MGTHSSHVHPAHVINTQHPGTVVTATQAVVLAAGAVHTPRLLMASGIGPAAALKAEGIKVVAPNEAVGNNFRDRNAISSVQLNLNKVDHTEFSLPNLGVCVGGGGGRVHDGWWVLIVGDACAPAPFICLLPLAVGVSVNH